MLAVMDLDEVMTDKGVPQACVCMNDGEHEILADGEPAEHHAALVAEIGAATRSDCVAAIPDGYAHNCLQIADGEVPAPLLTNPYEDESNPACVGSCNQIGDPPLGKPCEDPNPWECNGEEPPGAGDTGGGGETGGETGGGETGGGTTGLGPVHDRSLVR